MGLFSKMLGGQPKQKPGKRKTVKNGDWEILVREDGTPEHFDKKGKEWLDSDKAWASPSRTYFLHTGYNGNGDECIALTTATEGLKLKAMEEGVEAVVVLDSGEAFVLTDEGTLHTITPDRTSSKNLTEEKPDVYILTPKACAIVEDMGDALTVKGVDLAAGKSWKKAVKYEPPSDGSADISIAATGDIIEVTTPARTVARFSPAGEPIN